MRKQQTFAIASILLLGVGWYAFRPERLFIDSVVDQAAPPSNAQLLKSGTFTSDAHETTGTAAVYQLEGERLLRLADFATSNGPDVHVYLVAGKDASSGGVIRNAETIDLGVIKGNKGNQNYTLPKDVDLEKFSAVSIWCKRFGVNFGGATLKPEE